MLENANDHDDEPGEKLKKIKMIKNTQLTFFIFIHCVGNDNIIYPV